VRNDQDAEDVAQEACAAAFRFFEGFRGENSRAWFLSMSATRIHCSEAQSYGEEKPGFV